jgi:mannose-6-phosphate isomerase-like protein (cupin superfamily)
MSKHIPSPTMIQAQGNMPKLIEEYIGLVNTRTETVSIARMKSPEGWSEPGQTPEFEEHTIVLRGALHIETNFGRFNVRAGQAFIATAGEWVRYSSPEPGGAEYIAVCIPAFSPTTVHRDA